MISDQPNNESFCNLTERVQYNAAHAIRTTQTSTYLYIETYSLKKSGVKPVI